MTEPEAVTWRMRLRIGRAYSPTFLAYGAGEVNVSNSLQAILSYIKDAYIQNKGRIALSFTRNDEEFYTLSPYWMETAETFEEKCKERITWFCTHHEIPLKKKDYSIHARI